MFDINKENKIFIIIVAGLAGSGKTTIGKKIAKNFKWFYLDKDSLSRRFTEAMLMEKKLKIGDRESDYYGEIINPIEYKTLMDIAIENAKLGMHSILSAPFLMQFKNNEWFEAVEKKLDFLKQDVLVKKIWVKANRDIERIRLIERGAERDKGKLRNWGEYCENVKLIDPTSKFNDIYEFHNEDNGYNLSEKIEELNKWIQK